MISSNKNSYCILKYDLILCEVQHHFHGMTAVHYKVFLQISIRPCNDLVAIGRYNIPIIPNDVHSLHCIKKEFLEIVCVSVLAPICTTHRLVWIREMVVRFHLQRIALLKPAKGVTSTKQMTFKYII